MLRTESSTVACTNKETICYCGLRETLQVFFRVRIRARVTIMLGLGLGLGIGIGLVKDSSDCRMTLCWTSKPNQSLIRNEL